MGSSNAISNDSRHNCVYRMETELWGNSVFLICKTRNLNWKKIQDFLYFSPEINRHTYAAAAKLLQSCPTLCDPINGSPPGYAVPGILQARTLEWAAISFSNVWKWKVKVKSLSRAQLLATPWTGAYQAPPSTGFSRQEYWKKKKKVWQIPQSE